MPSLLHDDRGVAFGIVILAVLLIVGTVVVMAMTPAVNEFIGQFNKQVADGDVSTQRSDSMAWAVTVFNTSYIWLLLAALVWGLVRALEFREGT